MYRIYPCSLLFITHSCLALFEDLPPPLYENPGSIPLKAASAVHPHKKQLQLPTPFQSPRNGFDVSFFKTPLTNGIFFPDQDQLILIPPRFYNEPLSNWKDPLLSTYSINEPDKCQLYNKGQPLTNADTLQDLNVPLGAILQGKRPSTIEQIKVHWHPDDTEETFELPSDASIGSLLEGIGKKYEVDPSHISLNGQSFLGNSFCDPISSLPKNNVLEAALNTEESSSSPTSNRGISEVHFHEGDAINPQELAKISIGDIDAPSTEDQRVRFSSLLKKDCNPYDDGLENCATSPEAYVVLKDLHFRTIICTVVFIGITLWIVGALQKLVTTILHYLLNDKYIRELFEVTFRQITIVAVATALVNIVLTADIIEYTLDYRIFEEEYKRINFELDNYRRLTEIFEEIESVISNFVLAYVAFVCVFAILAYVDFRWLRRVEDLTVEEILTDHKKGSYLEFVVARYEFMDKSAGKGISGLDTKSIWFMEYYRACLLTTSTNLVRLPVTAMILVQLSTISIIPLYHWLYKHTGILFAIVMIIPASLITFVIFKIARIKAKILPLDKETYVTLRYHNDYDEDFITMRSRHNLEDIPIEDETRERNSLIKDQTNGSMDKAIPQYKLCEPDKSRAPRCIARYIYGTEFPNKHEMLFTLWRNGPKVLLRCAELAYFITLTQSAWLICQFNKIYRNLTFKHNQWAVILGLLLGVYVFATIPYVLNGLTYISCTGSMIKEKILSDVMVTNRSQFVERLARLVDSLKTKTLLIQVKSGGQEVLQALQTMMDSADDRTKAHREVLWDSLIAESGNATLTPPTLYTFFLLQGLKLGSIELVNEWFDVFGRIENNRKVITREEFDAVLAALGDTIREPIQKEPVQFFFEWKLDIGKGPHTLMGMKELDKLLESIHLKWTNAQKRHLITFMMNDINAREISVEDFIESLMRIEMTTLNVLNQAAQRMKAVSVPRPPLGIGESREIQEADLFTRTDS